MAVLLRECGLPYNGGGDHSGAQTERRGGAGPVRGLPRGKDLTGRQCWLATRAILPVPLLSDL
jgi:hypothetical protein